VRSVATFATVKGKKVDTFLARSLKVHRLRTAAFVTLIMALTGIAVLSCLQPRPSTECLRFYGLSTEERKAQLRASPIKEQLIFYNCGMYQEPPTDYAGDIADGGEKIIPPVLDQLKSERSETRQDFLIHIFEELALKEHLHGRRDISEQLQNVVSAMKDDDIKRRSERRLKIIQDNL
jgi:hypothetical protein